MDGFLKFLSLNLATCISVMIINRESADVYLSNKQILFYIYFLQHLSKTPIGILRSKNILRMPVEYTNSQVF